MYVGGTEANIAAMFRQAESEGAVLLLDEADSFLQNRRMAQRTWEITQVNELLVQMEAFDGLFICSTNLMDRLDSAVFRRFDLKIRFDYLTQDQAWTLFVSILSGARLSGPSENTTSELRDQLGRLTTLTPGDFATVLRQTRVMGQPCEGPHLLAALRDECRIKQDSGIRVSGFVA